LCGAGRLRWIDSADDRLAPRPPGSKRSKLTQDKFVLNGWRLKLTKVFKNRAVAGELPAHEPSRPPVDAVIPEIMTVPQVAEYLKTHPSTIYRLLKNRKIPAFRLGSDWRLRGADLEQWVAAQEIKVADEEPAAADAGGKRAARGPAASKPRRTRTR